LFSGPEAGFEVEDVGLARQEMVARGARFITEVETWEEDAWAHFLGPEETLFGIQQPSLRYPEKSGMILNYSWAGLVVQDLDGAVNFFEKVMEMPLARRDDGREFAHFRLPAGHLFEIFGPNNSWSRLMSRITIAFEVDDVWQTRVNLEEKGVEFVSDVIVTSIGEVFTYFRGPDGYLYEIWKPVIPAAG
jgi:predicted enzyme related to lactoylglutathione lyase